MCTLWYSIHLQRLQILISLLLNLLHCKCLQEITGFLGRVSAISAGKTCNICRDFPAICKYYRVFPVNIAEICPKNPVISCKHLQCRFCSHFHYLMANAQVKFIFSKKATKCSASQIYSGDFATFCVLLGIHELYDSIRVFFWGECKIFCPELCNRR